MRDGTDRYEPGELFVYTNGDRWELGMVKRDAGDGRYFCWYSGGDTAARTPTERMHKLENAGWTHVEGALDRACKLLAEFTGSCPRDVYDMDEDGCEGLCFEGVEPRCWADHLTGRRLA